MLSEFENNAKQSLIVNLDTYLIQRVTNNNFLAIKTKRFISQITIPWLIGFQCM